MRNHKIAISETRETIYFAYEGKALRQWIGVTVESHLSQPKSGTVTIRAGGEEVSTQLDIEPGVKEYRCYAPTLWPDHQPESKAPVHLVVGEDVADAVTSVGTHRPWKIYLLTDACTDYTWVYDNVGKVHADDAAILEAEMTVSEQTGENAYNLVHARKSSSTYSVTLSAVSGCSTISVGTM
jgi:hypothetical protein